MHSRCKGDWLSLLIFEPSNHEEQTVRYIQNIHELEKDQQVRTNRVLPVSTTVRLKNCEHKLVVERESSCTILV